MAHDPLKMVSVDEALDCVLAAVDHLEAETVEVLDAVGRIAAADLTSDCDIAPFDNAAMDGYAVHSADLFDASEAEPVVLPVTDEVPAGAVLERTLMPGEAVRIMTGAPVPEGADAVVKYEVVDYLDTDGRKGTRVAFSSPAKSGDNIREKGEEIKTGEVAIHKGEEIGAAGVGFLASCGIVEVPVYRRPRVAVIAIGTELVDAADPLRPGCIRDSNSLALAACVRAAGGIPELMERVPDDEQALADAVLSAVRSCDFVVTSGGASNGDYDFIKPVVERLGSLHMTLVDMRPGKAQTFGLVEGTPVFGLPGNPAAAYCGFEVLVRQALRKMQGHTTFARPTVRARLVGNRKKKDARRIYLRATLKREVNGSLCVESAKNQSSGLFGTLQRANCLAILPEGVPESKRVEDGTVLNCILLNVEEGTVL